MMFKYFVNNLVSNKVSDENFVQEKELPDSDSEESLEEFYDAEILDEMTTNRGEVKLRTVNCSEDRFFQVTF
jgi:hypothetical protein